MTVVGASVVPVPDSAGSRGRRGRRLAAVLAAPGTAVASDGPTFPDACAAVREGGEPARATLRAVAGVGPAGAARPRAADLDAAAALALLVALRDSAAPAIAGGLLAPGTVTMEKLAALSRLRPQDLAAVPRLALAVHEALTSPDDEVRHAAVRCAGRIGEPGFAPRLAEMLRTWDDHRIAWALIRCGGGRRLLAELRRRLAAGGPELARTHQMLLSLARQADPGLRAEVWPILAEEAVRPPTPGCDRTPLVLAVAEHGGPAAAEVLAEIVREAGEDAARTVALDRLAVLDPGAAGALAGWFWRANRSRPDCAAAAARVLGRVYAGTAGTAGTAGAGRAAAGADPVAELTRLRKEAAQTAASRGAVAEALLRIGGGRARRRAARLVGRIPDEVAARVRAACSGAPPPERICARLAELGLVPPRLAGRLAGVLGDHVGTPAEVVHDCLTAAGAIHLLEVDGPTPPDHVAFVDRLAEASGGVFDPDGVRQRVVGMAELGDGSVETRAVLEIEHRGWCRRVDTVTRDGWVDVSAVLSAAGELLAALGVADRFVVIPGGGRTVRMFFGDPGAFARAVEEFGFAGAPGTAAAR